jgi:hypothetical protein
VRGWRYEVSTFVSCSTRLETKGTIIMQIGQELSKFFLSNNKSIIDISELQNGLYFLKINDGNKTGIKKLIINGK